MIYLQLFHPTLFIELSLNNLLTTIVRFKAIAIRKEVFSKVTVNTNTTLMMCSVEKFTLEPVCS